MTGHGSPRAAPQTSVAQRRQSAGPGLGRAHQTDQELVEQPRELRPFGGRQRGERVGEDRGAVVGDRPGPAPTFGGQRDDRHPAVVGRAPGDEPLGLQRVDEAHHPRRRQAEHPPQRVDAWRIHEEPFDHRHHGRRRRRRARRQR